MRSSFALCAALSLLAGASATAATGHDDTAATGHDDVPNVCSTGVMQSPLALHSCSEEPTLLEDSHDTYNMPAERPKMTIGYGADRAAVERVCEPSGCFVRLTPGSDLGVVLSNAWTVPGDPTHTFQLEHCDVRMPSEHTVNGQSYPLEVQCVHSQDGTDSKRKGILSVLFENGMTSYEEEEAKETSSGFIAQFAKKIPNGTSASEMMKPFGWGVAGEEVGLTRYWNYGGSRTSGHCQEDAEWYIMYDSSGISQAQLKDLKDAFPQGWLPPRPTQKAYGRHPHGCMHKAVAEDAAYPSGFGALSLALALFSVIARA